MIARHPSTIAYVTVVDGYHAPRQVSFRMWTGTPLWHQMLHAAFSKTSAAVLSQDKGQLYLRGIRSIEALTASGAEIIKLDIHPGG